MIRQVHRTLEIEGFSHPADGEGASGELEGFLSTGEVGRGTEMSKSPNRFGGEIRSFFTKLVPLFDIFQLLSVGFNGPNYQSSPPWGKLLYLKVYMGSNFTVGRS